MCGFPVDGLVPTCLDISSAPIVRNPVLEIPWIMTFLASVSTLLISPKASLAAFWKKSSSPPMGAYSLFRLLVAIFCFAWRKEQMLI